MCTFLLKKWHIVEYLADAFFNFSVLRWCMHLKSFLVKSKDKHILHNEHHGWSWSWLFYWQWSSSAKNNQINHMGSPGTVHITPIPYTLTPISLPHPHPYKNVCILYVFSRACSSSTPKTDQLNVWYTISALSCLHRLFVSMDFLFEKRIGQVSTDLLYISFKY